MHPFDLMCRNHPERVIDERGRADRFCTECYANAWNAGARQADATWHKQPHKRPLWELRDEWITQGKAER